MLTNLEALRLLFLITYANSVAVPVTDSGDQTSGYQSKPGYALSTNQNESSSGYSDYHTEMENKTYTDIQKSTTQIPEGERTTMNSRYTDKPDYYSESVTTGNHDHYRSSEDKTTNEIPSSTTLPPSLSTHGQHEVYTTGGAWITHSSETPAKHSDNDVYTETTPSPFDIYSRETGNTAHDDASSSGYSTEEEKSIIRTSSLDEDREDDNGVEDMFSSVMPQSTLRPPLNDFDVSNNAEKQEEGSDGSDNEVKAAVYNYADDYYSILYHYFPYFDYTD